MRKQTTWIPNRSKTTSLYSDRRLKFWTSKEEELYSPCSENKVADQLRSYSASLFSHMQNEGFPIRRLMELLSL